MRYLKQALAWGLAILALKIALGFLSQTPLYGIFDWFLKPPYSEAKVCGFGFLFLVVGFYISIWLGLRLRREAKEEEER